MSSGNLFAHIITETLTLFETFRYVWMRTAYRAQMVKTFFFMFLCMYKNMFLFFLFMHVV